MPFAGSATNPRAKSGQEHHFLLWGQIWNRVWWQRAKTDREKVIWEQQQFCENNRMLLFFFRWQLSPEKYEICASKRWEQGVSIFRNMVNNGFGWKIGEREHPGPQRYSLISPIYLRSIRIPPNSPKRWPELAQISNRGQKVDNNTVGLSAPDCVPGRWQKGPDKAILPKCG